MGADVVVIVIVGVLVFALIVAAGTRMLRSGSGKSSGVHHALGNFIDVFDPARSRAEEDLKSQKHRGPVTPSPDDEDLPVTIDLDKRTARIKPPKNRA